MSREDHAGAGGQSLLEAWMKVAMQSWGSMLHTMQAASSESYATDSSQAGGKSRWLESWETNVKAVHALAAAMSEPEAMEDLLKGVKTLPEIMVKMVQPAWESLFHLQKEWLEKAGRIGKSTAAYSFENLDQEAFRVWTEIYEKEFRQFLHIPQLGLTRFYQERMTEATDKFNIFQANISEFLNLLYLPVEKTAKVMQDQLAAMADEGKLPDKPKDYYRIWIKILEGHYMTLFKSPEYTQELKKTMRAMGEFIVARQRMLEDMLRVLPVPTQRDMDDLYKELYVLKKRIRELEKKTKEREGREQ